MHSNLADTESTPFSTGCKKTMTWLNKTLIVRTTLFQLTKNFYDLRTQSRNIYANFLTEEAETHQLCNEISSAIVNNDEKKIEFYQLLLEGTERSVGEFNSQNELYDNISEIYVIRVEKGLEETSAYSDQLEASFDLPGIEMCSSQTIKIARSYSAFMKEYSLKLRLAEELHKFVKT